MNSHSPETPCVTFRILFCKKQVAIFRMEALDLAGAWLVLQRGCIFHYCRTASANKASTCMCMVLFVHPYDLRLWFFHLHSSQDGCCALCVSCERVCHTTSEKVVVYPGELWWRQPWILTRTINKFLWLLLYIATLFYKEKEKIQIVISPNIVCIFTSDLNFVFCSKLHWILDHANTCLFLLRSSCPILIAFKCMRRGRKIQTSPALAKW